jgi:transposase-like protein
VSVVRSSAASSARMRSRTSVSETCRVFGIHRSTYYVWKRRAERHGLEILRPRERRRPRMPQQVSPFVEARMWQLTAIDIASRYAWAELVTCAKGNPTGQRTSRLARRGCAELASAGLAAGARAYR